MEAIRVISPVFQKLQQRLLLLFIKILDLIQIQQDTIDSFQCSNFPDDFTDICGGSGGAVQFIKVFIAFGGQSPWRALSSQPRKARKKIKFGTSPCSRMRRSGAARRPIGAAARQSRQVFGGRIRSASGDAIEKPLPACSLSLFVERMCLTQGIYRRKALFFCAFIIVDRIRNALGRWFPYRRALTHAS